MSTDEISGLRNEFARSLDRLTDKLEAFTERLETIARKQAEQARDIVHGACPSPGSCVSLGSEVKKLGERLEPLENAFLEAKGARRARLFIGATISGCAGVFGAVAPHVFELFTK
jgi:hypothetical protein